MHRRQPRLSQTRPYKAGAGENIGLAAPKPSWCANNTLVIAGINKEFLNNKKGINEKIDILASRAITIHHMEVLSREVKGRAFDWLTVAVELSEDDFTLLSPDQTPALLTVIRTLCFHILDSPTLGFAQPRVVKCIGEGQGYLKPAHIRLALERISVLLHPNQVGVQIKP